MTPALRKILLEDAFNPYQLSGNAAVYSVDGGESDATYRTNGLGRVKLIADRSGNSAVNCLVLNGIAGNYASSPDSAAARITGDIDIRCKISLNSWASGVNQTFFSKYQAASDQRSYLFMAVATGELRAIISVDGINGLSATSTVQTGFAAFTTKWVRFIRTQSTGEVIFYSSDDGSNWSQLGSPVVVGAGSAIFAGSAAVQIGAWDGINNMLSGVVYRTQLRSGINGTIAFDKDFSLDAKLSTTSTESSANAATVTINTSGDLGARISGARDLVQLTTTKMPLLGTAADGKPIATFDGSNDYMKAAPFSLSQPETVYFVGSQVTWTAGDYFYDGNTGSVPSLRQSGTSAPDVRANGGFDGNLFSEFVVGVRGIVTVVFNGSSSSIRLNRRAMQAETGLGTTASGGFTIGAASGGTVFGNIAFCETIIAARADTDSVQLRIASPLMRKWLISA